MGDGQWAGVDGQRSGIDGQPEGTNPPPGRPAHRRWQATGSRRRQRLARRNEPMRRPGDRRLARGSRPVTGVMRTAEEIAGRPDIRRLAPPGLRALLGGDGTSDGNATEAECCRDQRCDGAKGTLSTRRLFHAELGLRAATRDTPALGNSGMAPVTSVVCRAPSRTGTCPKPAAALASDFWRPRPSDCVGVTGAQPCAPPSPDRFGCSPGRRGRGCSS